MQAAETCYKACDGKPVTTASNKRVAMHKTFDHVRTTQAQRLRDLLLAQRYGWDVVKR